MNFTALFFSCFCALACVGIAIYYFCVANTAAAVVYLVVGVACAVPAVRALWKRRKGDDDDEE